MDSKEESENFICFLVCDSFWNSCSARHNTETYNMKYCFK